MTDVINNVPRELLRTIEQSWRIPNGCPSSVSEEVGEIIANGLRELRALLAKPADGWPTAEMIIHGAEDLHDSLRTFGLEISDGQLRATEIEQEIAESLFRHMLAAAPKAGNV